MADTIREQIILAALVQLAKITTANGYQYTMGVPLRARKSVAPGLIPMSNVFPQVEENTQNFGKNTPVFSLRVESLQNVALTENASVIQEKLLPDLRRNLTDPADKWYTGLADSVGYTEGGPADQPEADATTTAVYVLLTIEYKTAIGNPYSP